MDSKIVFVKTAKGEEEARSKTAHLSGDIKRALLMVDGSATYAEITKRAAPSLRTILEAMLYDLVKGGFIQDKARVGNVPRMVVPTKMSVPVKKSVDDGEDELDFTSAYRAPTPEILAAEAAKVQAEKLKTEAAAEAQRKAEEKARQLAEAEKLQAQKAAEQARIKAESEAKAREAAERQAKEEAQAARLKAEQEAIKMRAELELARAKAEADAKLRLAQEAQAKEAAEAARIKAEKIAEQARKDAELAKQQAAEEARSRAEAEQRAKQEAEAARAKAEQEAALARAELAAAKARAEEEAKARAEAEKKAQLAAEAAKVKAQQEAEAARAKAEQEAAQARAELAAAKARAEEEAKARAEAEKKAQLAAEATKVKAQQEADAARAKAEQEAAQARAELAAAKAKAEEEAKARADAEAKLRAESEEKLRLAAEAAALKTKQDAEVARLKAEQEVEQARKEAELAKQQAELVKQQAAEEARSRAEAEQRAKQEAEAARAKAEQEAERARAELAVAKIKAEAEAKSRAEVEEKLRLAAEAATLKAQQAAEVARLKAEQEAVQAQKEAELAAQQAVAAAREEALKLAAQEAESARVKAEQDAAKAHEDELLLLQSAQDLATAKTTFDVVKLKTVTDLSARSTSATVLFFDVVGYTKQSVNKQIVLKNQFNQLVSECLKSLGEGERIILDTGDGAAIGFMQHPEDALEVAMQFRDLVLENNHQNYPDLKVRVGIHLGPVNIIKDMNGQSNMVGDGINDAQRVMSFAADDQIFISRSYYDFVSRLSDEYAELFHYRGGQKDKHGREHQVYELVDARHHDEPVAPTTLAQSGTAIKLDPFSFDVANLAARAPEAEVAKTEVVAPVEQPEVEILPNDKKNAPPVAPVAVAEPAKPEAVQRVLSEEEIKLLADVQAKAWTNAEQRAVEAAKANAERAMQQHAAHIQAEIVQEKAAVRAVRKPVPWRNLSIGMLVLVVLALFAVPAVLPMQSVAVKIGQILTARLNQPVHVGRVAARLLPTPRLELSEIAMGATKPVQAQSVQLNFSFAALFSASKPINSVEIQGFQVSGAALQQAATWFQQIAADGQYPIARIIFSQGKLEMGRVALTGVAGEINFDSAQKFTSAKFNAEGNKYSVDLNTMSDNKLQVAIAVRGAALPWLPSWNFDELNAKGELSRDELVVAEIDSRLLGGVMLGNARVNWREGWNAQGSLEAKSIPTQNLNKLLAGDVDASANFKMQAGRVDQLAESSVLEGAFVIKQGSINGMDIVETARLHSKENLPGGRTHFDGLSGDLTVVGSTYAFRQLKLKTGVLTASGQLDVNKQQLSGRLAAELSMRAGLGTVTLQVGGTTESPTLKMAK